MSKFVPFVTLALVTALSSAACHKNSQGQGPMEAAGSKVDEGAEKTKNAAENAGEGIKDAFKSDGG